jgi:uncharacterized protein YgbK (DUF1537 family)
MAIIKAEKKGKRVLCRSSATFVSIRAGITPGKVYAPEKAEGGDQGSLIVVGSYVPKTTGQLQYLLQHDIHSVIEISVPEILQAQDTADEIRKLIQKTDRWIASGHDVLIYTSRALEVGKDMASSLRINSVVSTFLVEIVKGLTVRPAFIIAKGGITSSDLASRALAAESAVVLGQAIPGVPVWRLDSNSKFPGINYVVFPGNVGDEAALSKVWNKFKSAV